MCNRGFSVWLQGQKTQARIEWWTGESHEDQASAGEDSGPRAVESLQIMIPLFRISQVRIRVSPSDSCRIEWIESQADIEDLMLARRRLVDIASSTTHQKRQENNPKDAALLRRKVWPGQPGECSWDAVLLCSWSGGAPSCR